MQEDPLGYVDGADVYQDVGDDPVWGLDPFGLHWNYDSPDCKAAEAAYQEAAWEYAKAQLAFAAELGRYARASQIIAVDQNELEWWAEALRKANGEALIMASGEAVLANLQGHNPNPYAAKQCPGGFSTPMVINTTAKNLIKHAQDEYDKWLAKLRGDMPLYAKVSAEYQAALVELEAAQAAFHAASYHEVEVCEDHY